LQLPLWLLGCCGPCGFFTTDRHPCSDRRRADPSVGHLAQGRGGRNFVWNDRNASRTEFLSRAPLASQSDRHFWQTAVLLKTRRLTHSDSAFLLPFHPICPILSLSAISLSTQVLNLAFSSLLSVCLNFVVVATAAPCSGLPLPLPEASVSFASSSSSTFDTPSAVLVCLERGRRLRGVLRMGHLHRAPSPVYFASCGGPGR